MAKIVKKVAFGTLIGAAVGYVAGVLTAPKSGKETRKDIKDTASNSILVAEKRLKKIHTQLNESIDKAKKFTASVTGKTKGNIEDAINKAQESKEKVRLMLSAIHEGDAEDKDLKIAIGQSTKALDHLKKFFKKAS
ncbi:MAG TPA: YtxH domain-containing protein [Candidatus Saccharimonadales bacterium]|jgi:gas vesicle protein|nr:YtxH domain-containing protein [Candidatus Saccharimonadales bacterium]